MTGLAELFDFDQREAIAIIGSGGKTTLLWYLAAHFRAEKVLVTPTTKIFLPPRWKQTPPNSQEPAPANGSRKERPVPDQSILDQFVPDSSAAGQSISGQCVSGQYVSGQCISSQPYYDRLYDAAALSRIPEAMTGITLAGQFAFTPLPGTGHTTGAQDGDPLPPKKGATPGVEGRSGLEPPQRLETAPQTISSHAPPPAKSLPEKNSPSQTEAPTMARPRRAVSQPERFAHKISALPPAVLFSQRHLFEKIFMECDGSRNLPLKGWAPHEPVIPDFTTVTVAVIPLWAVGLKAGDDCIHRAGLFYPMAQCAAGDTIGLEHLARVIAHPRGLLAKAKGKKVLLFHLEKPAQLPLAKDLAALLPLERKHTIGRIIAGSAREGWGTLLHQVPMV